MAHSLMLGPFTFGVIHECDWCGSYEERVFIDSVTGLELCCGCLWGTVEHITLSPGEEENILNVLTKYKKANRDDEAISEAMKRLGLKGLKPQKEARQ